MIRCSQSCRFVDPKGDAQAAGGGHLDQHVQTEEVDFAVDEVGDARLSYAENLCGLGLGQAFVLIWRVKASMSEERSLRFSALTGLGSRASHTLL